MTTNNPIITTKGFGHKVRSRSNRDYALIREDERGPEVIMRSDSIDTLVTKRRRTGGVHRVFGAKVTVVDGKVIYEGGIHTYSYIYRLHDGEAVA